MNHLISVIIVNWNGREHLDECLDALSQQTYCNFETIFVDNGSTDGSVEFVENNYRVVKLLKLGKNEGFCRGNNIGLRHASGEFIALLNNDTKADKYWLQEMYSAINTDPKVGICASCMVNYFNRDVIDTAGDGFDICGVGFKIGNNRPAASFQRLSYVFGACAGAALYRRSMLEEIGSFDDDYFAVGEDIDLSFRARLYGYKCIYAPKAIVYHKVNQTIRLYSRFLAFYAKRNVEYTYFKNMPGLLMALTLPLHLLYMILSGIDAAMKGNLIEYFEAKLAFLRNWPVIMKKRNYIQKRRNISSFTLLADFSSSYLLWKFKEFLKQHYND